MKIMADFHSLSGGIVHWSSGWQGNYVTGVGCVPGMSESQAGKSDASNHISLPPQGIRH